MNPFFKSYIVKSLFLTIAFFTRTCSLLSLETGIVVNATILFCKRDPSGIEAFKEELSKYKGAKGSVQFPIGEPLPYGLISRIVEFRVHENIKRAENKKHNIRN